MGHAVEGLLHDFAVLDGAVHILNPFMRFKCTVMTQCPDGKRVEFGICQQALNKYPSYFACSASNEYDSRVGHLHSLSKLILRAALQLRSERCITDQHLTHLPLDLLDSITLSTKRMPSSPSHELGKYNASRSASLPALRAAMASAASE